MEQKRVFFSYSSKDKTVCDKLVAALRLAEADVWYAEDSGSGLVWENIYSEISAREWFVVALSKKSYKSLSVRRECTAADFLASTEIHRKGMIVPVTVGRVRADYFSKDWARLTPYKRIESNLRPLPESTMIEQTVRALGLTPPRPFPSKTSVRHEPRARLATAAVVVVSLILVVTIALQAVMPSLVPWKWPRTAVPTPSPTLISRAVDPTVSQVVSAEGVDDAGHAVGVTREFAMNSSVYLVATVHEAKDGHIPTASVIWYLNGENLEIPVTKEPLRNGQVWFSLFYPVAGNGMAKLFIDKPPNDPGNDPSDPTLATSITFLISDEKPTTTR